MVFRSVPSVSVSALLYLCNASSTHFSVRRHAMCRDLQEASLPSSPPSCKQNPPSFLRTLFFLPPDFKRRSFAPAWQCKKCKPSPVVHHTTGRKLISWRELRESRLLAPLGRGRRFHAISARGWLFHSLLILLNMHRAVGFSIAIRDGFMGYNLVFTPRTLRVLTSQTHLIPLLFCPSRRIQRAERIHFVRTPFSPFGARARPTLC